VTSLGRVQTVNGIITQGSLHSGYLRIGRGVKNYSVPRLVALTFCPKEPDKNYVNHIDGDSTNNKISNLEWCTQKKKYATRCNVLDFAITVSINGPLNRFLLMVLLKNFYH